MPIVRIDIQSGKSTAYKRAVLHGVRSAITAALGRGRRARHAAPHRDARRGHRRHAEPLRLAHDHRDLDAARSRARSQEQALRGDRRQPRRDPGIHAHDIMVLVNDPSAECFAIGGVMQCTLAPQSAEADEDEDES